MKKVKKIAKFFLVFVLAILLVMLFKPHEKVKLKEYGKILPLKVLIADKTKTKENVTLDEMNDGDIDLALFFSYGNLNLRKKGNYYEGDLSNLNEYAFKNITDYVFANNNTRGEVLDDCILDKKTTKIKIPSKYLDETDNNIPIQLEILSRLSPEEFSNLPVKVEVNRYSKKIKKEKIEGSDTTTLISIAGYKELRGVSQDEINVYVNDNSKLNYDDFAWDPTSGTIEMAINPILVRNVKVMIDKKTVVTNILGILNVKAVKYGNMKVYAKLKEAPTIADGAIKTINLSSSTFDYMGFQTDTAAKACSGITNDSTKWSKYMACKEGWKKAYGYSGSYASSYVSVKNPKVDGLTEGQKGSFYTTAQSGNIYLDFLAKLTNTDIGGLKFSTDSGKLWISLACYHAGKDAYDSTDATNGYFPSGGTATAPKLQIKVLYKNTDKNYIVLGFKTTRVNSQNGFGIYKFSYQTEMYGNVKVHKKFKNADNTENNGKFTVAFGLFGDENCSDKLDEQYILDNNTATFEELELNEDYYVKETIIPIHWSPEEGTEEQPTTCKKVKATKDSPTVDINYYNIPALSCFTVQKKSDIPGVPGVDATFEIYKGSTLLQNAYTNSSNGYQFTYGPFQDTDSASYYFKEISSDPNYYLDHDYLHLASKYDAIGSSCVPTASNINSVTDTRKTYCTRLIKKDKTSSNIIRSISNLCFEAESKGHVDPDYGTLSCQSLIDNKTISGKSTKFKICSDPNCTNVIKDNMATNELGIAAIRGLQNLQDYYVKETQAPDGYTINPETLKISSSTLNEQRFSFGRCSNLIDDSSDIYYHEPFYHTNPNAFAANEKLNIYYYTYWDEDSEEIYDSLRDSVNKIKQKISSKPSPSSPNYDSNYYDNYYINGNDIQINLIRKTYSDYDSTEYNELKTIIDSVYEFDPDIKRQLRASNSAGESNYFIKTPIIIIGKNVFFYNTHGGDYSNYSYNLNRLNNSSYDYNYGQDNTESAYKKFFMKYLDTVTSKKIDRSSLSYGFRPAAGKYSYEYNKISYYDMLHSITSDSGILKRIVNSDIKMDIITTSTETDLNNNYNNLSSKESAVLAALRQALNKLNDELNLSSSGHILDPRNFIQIHSLSGNYTVNGVTIKNADLYPNLVNIFYHNYSYTEFSRTKAQINKNEDSPTVIIGGIPYSYDRGFYDTQYKDYISYDDTNGKYDISKLSNYFYQKLRQVAASDSIGINEFDRLESNLAKFLSIRTPAGYLALVNGTSDYAPVSSYDGTDQYGTLSVPFYNYKYKLNWYKETENGTKAAGAKFTVSKGSTQIHHTGASNKISVTDDSGVTKTCYMYSTNASDPTEFESDSNGEVCINGLEEGSYTVTETKPAAYHTFESTKTKTLSANEKFSAISNANKFINLKTEFVFTKSVSSGNSGSWENVTTQELKKIPFVVTNSSNQELSFIKTSDGVYEYSGNTIDASSGTPVTELYLNNDRQIKIYHLPIGTYNIKEKKACCDSACPTCTGSEECTGFYYPNYAAASDYEFTITDCSNSGATSCATAAASVQSLTNVPTQIELTKKDLYNYADATSTVKFENEEERSAFDDITFKLKDSSGNYVKLVKVGNNGNCKTDGSYAEYRYVPSSMLGDMQTTEELHTCGGHIHITHLCRGKKYTMEEYSVPDNTVFALPDTHISKDYYLPYTEDGKSCCDNPTTTTNTTATIEDEPTVIKIEKKDNRTGDNIIEGSTKKETAEFKVYKCAKTVSKCTYDASDKKAIKFKELATVNNEKTYRFLLDQSQTSGYITTLNLNSDGKIIIKYLPANYKYVVVEENAPDGYYNLEGELADLEVLVPKNVTSSSNNTYNRTNYPTKIKFKKEDIYKYYNSNDLAKIGENNKIFDSMTFVLHDQDGNIVKLSKVQDGEYRFIQTNGEASATTNTVTELHTKDGEFIITHLYRNETYYIEETKTDTEGNFILPNNINNTSLVESRAGNLKNNKHPIVKYKIPNDISDASKSVNVPESLTELVENLPTRVVFEKRDAKTSELIDDSKIMQQFQTRTTFNIYRCPKTSATCTIDNGEIVYFKDRQYIKDSGGNDLTRDITSIAPPVLAYEYSKLNNSTNAVSDLITDRGVLVLAYLPSEYKYVLYEKIAPNGYYQPTKAEAQHEFVVKNGSLSDGSTYEGLTDYVDNTPTEIYFTKSDLYSYAQLSNTVKFENEEERNAFDTITFKLKDSNGNYLNLTKDYGSCTSGVEYSEYIYEPEENTNISTNSSTGTNLHTCNGKMKISYLYREKSYTLEEFEVPDNTIFILPDNHPEVTYNIEKNKPSTKNQKEIKDTPTRILIQKKNNRLSESIKEGDSKKDKYNNEYIGKFKVYKCASTVATCTYDLSDKKAIKFLDLQTISGDSEDPGEKVYKFVLNQNATTGYVQELKLNENGKLILRYLPANYKYVVVEENAPAGYYNLSPSSNALANLEVVNAKNTTNKNFDFINYPTIIEFDKDDIYKYYKSSDLDKINSNIKIFDSMTFKLHDYKGEIVKLQKVSDGDYRYIQNDGNTSANTVTDLHTKDGKMVITNLNREQTYYIEETRADTLGNFILPNNINNTSLIDNAAGSFRNVKHPVVRYDIPKNIADETKKNSAPVSLTKLIENLPTRVVFEKRDKRTGELIDDDKNMVLNAGKADTDQSGQINYGNIRTTFNVYYCEKTSQNDTSPCEINESRKVYFKERQYISDADGNDITSDITSINSPVLTYEYSKLNDSTNAVSDLITDRGLLVLAYLPSEYKYVLYEKTAPNGYYQPDERDENLKIQFRVNGSSLETGETYTKLTSINENTPTEIMFVKSDFYDYYNSDDVANLNTNVKLFDTARFVLRDSKGNILKLKEVETNEEEGHVYRYLPINDSNTNEEIYTYKGKLKITHLYRNSVYYIEEFETTDPKHFVLPDYMRFEGLPFDNQGHPVVKYVVPDEKPEEAITVTKEIENIPTRVRFEKRDSRYNYLIPDETATFKVYQCKKDNEGNNTDCHPTDGDDENSVLMTFTERHVLSGTDMYGVSHNDKEDPKDAEGLEGVEVYTYAKLNQGTVTDLHPYHGLLVLRYLPAGYNYVLVETIAPKNYVLPKGRDAETKFTVVDNTVYVDPNDVPNVPTSIIIKKYNENSDKLLAGAEFRMYRADTKCNFNQKPWSQIGLTEVKLKTIRDGVYEARPETDTSTIKTCLDKEGALCTDISTNSSMSSEIYLTDDEYKESYADFGNMVVKENLEPSDKLTIHEGEALVQYLEYGHCYVIEETKAPKGYSLPKNKKDRFTMIQIDENEQYAHDTQFVFKNTPTPFTFYKYDEFNQLLDGAEFKLQKLNDDKIYEDVSVIEEEKEIGLFYKYQGLAKSEEDNTAIHTIDGKATVYYLPAGQYRIVETKAAPGKELTKNPNIATFFVDDAGNTFGNAIVVNKPETEKLTLKNSASAELIVNIQTGQIIIKYSAIIITLLSFIAGLIIVKRKIE